MKLTRTEAGSPLWGRIAEYLEARLADKRKENDHDRDPIKTAYLRGQILELKELLRLADDDDKAPPEDQDSNVMP